MADVQTGTLLGDHWGLLVALSVAAAGIWHFTRTVMASLDERIQTNLHLWAGNGGGDKIRSLVAEGVRAGLDRHRFECPLRGELRQLEDQLRDIRESRGDEEERVA